MQSHMRLHCSYNCKTKIIFYLPQALSLLSLSSLHFFLLSSLCASLMWFADECALLMIVLRRWSWVVVWCAPVILWVWVCGSEFMGMGLWFWVRGSAICGASTSQSTSKSWTRKALLRRNGIASLAIASQSRMFTTIRRLFTVILGTDSRWWVLAGVEIEVVGFGWGWEWGGCVVTEVGCCGWGVGLGFDGFCLPWVLGLWVLFAALSFASLSSSHGEASLSQVLFSFCCCCRFLFSFLIFLAMGLIFGWMLIMVVVGWPWVWVCCWILMVYGGGGYQWLAVEKEVV